MKAHKIISLITLTAFLFLDIVSPFSIRAGDWTNGAGAPVPLSEEDRASFGNIGLAEISFPPNAKFETYAVGKAAGIGKGFLEGFGASLSGIQGFSCQSKECGAVLIVFLAAGLIGGTIGAITGALRAIPPKEAARIEDSARLAVEDFRVQELLQEAFLQAVREKTLKNIIPLDGRGPRAPGETADYRGLQREEIQTVLEISACEIGFKTPPVGSPEFRAQDPPLHLFLRTQVRLLRLADGKTLYAPRFELARSPRKRAEWEAENSRAFFEEMEAMSRLVAEKVTDDLFLTFVLP